MFTHCRDGRILPVLACQDRVLRVLQVCHGLLQVLFEHDLK